jgi:hypothetical protein
MAAATHDIDAVEDRLGTLFDRAEQQGKRGGRARKQAEAEGAGRRTAEDRAVPDSGERDQDWDEEDWLDGDLAGDEASAGGDGDDDDSLAALDEALASEAPEKVKKGLFRRRS